VYGTKGLRVVDASILPLWVMVSLGIASQLTRDPSSELTAHLMPAIYAIAQRAADLILEDA
jgi:hypothetical protein